MALTEKPIFTFRIDGAPAQAFAGGFVTFGGIGCQASALIGSAASAYRVAKHAYDCATARPIPDRLSRAFLYS